MRLFGKKKEEKSCCCGNINLEAMTNAEEKKQEEGIKILGSGCAKCNELEKNTKIALEELDMNIEIDHITDFAMIAAYGVMSTPALVYNGKVISYGKVLSPSEIKKLLNQ